MRAVVGEHSHLFESSRPNDICSPTELHAGVNSERPLIRFKMGIKMGGVADATNKFAICWRYCKAMAEGVGFEPTVRF